MNIIIPDTEDGATRIEPLQDDAILTVLFTDKNRLVKVYNTFSIPIKDDEYIYSMSITKNDPFRIPILKEMFPDGIGIRQYIGDPEVFTGFKANTAQMKIEIEA